MDNLPIEMNAIVLEKKGAKHVLKKIPVPTPGPGQVLIKVDSSPINPSDLMFLANLYGAQKPFPAVAGFEGAGTIVSKDELFGKRVAFITGETSGTYAEYAIADSFLCIPIVDDKITLQLASSSFVNPVTVIGMCDVVKSANVTAVVQTAAASQLGRMMVRYFQKNGIKVINVVRRQDQADILKKEGAENILNQTDADFFEKLTEISTQLKATICFDAIGGEFTGKILSALPDGTTIYNYGCLSGESVSQVSALDLIFKRKTVTGFWLADWIQKPNNLVNSMAEIQLMLSSSLKSEIAKEFTLEQFDEALKFYTANMSAGKTLIRPFLGK